VIVDPAMFLRGMAIGFSIAAPVGPIGVLCIRRTLADGRGVGLATGLGAATADAAYGGIAGFGITVIAGLLLGAQVWIRLIGGLFLIYLGARTFAGTPADQPAEAEGHTLLRAYTSAVALTLTNPSTILSFVAIFAGVGVGTGRHAGPSAVLLVLGVWCGSAVWWVILSTTFAVMRAKVTSDQLRWINRLSGMILIVFGLVAFAGLRGR
jgi:threonine/homoserine/homoserine lactone efflux protein